jgi:hypothetical protein
MFVLPISSVISRTKIAVNEACVLPQLASLYILILISSATTFSTMTYSIMTLRMTIKKATLSIKFHCIEWHLLYDNEITSLIDVYFYE